MLISWNWLNRHIDLHGLDPKAVGEEFTLKVAELGDVYPVGHARWREDRAVLKVDPRGRQKVIRCGDL